MNLRKIVCLTALAVAVLLLSSANQQAEAMNPWGRPTYSGYPAYGYQYHYVHHHHYVYRPHYHHWHPAGWGNHGPYGGWYGGGFIWHGPGNCEACAHNQYYQNAPNPGAAAQPVAPTTSDDVPEEPGTDLIPELPELP